MVVMACCVALPSAAHSGKARFHVVADTDAAGDDLRSLAAMLASDEIEVLAVTASDGSLPPQEGAAKVRSMLHALYHEGIPVTAGREVLKKAPDWRTSCRAVPWGPDVPEPTAKQAAELIVESVMGEEEPVYRYGNDDQSGRCAGASTGDQGSDRTDRMV